MKQKIKKSLSCVLAAMLVLAAVPDSFILTGAAASGGEMEGTSKEVLDTLRIPSTPVDVGEDGVNPYSENTDTMINIFPRMELMMRDNVNDDIRNGGKQVNRTLVYDYDQNESGNIWDNEESYERTSEYVHASNSVGIEIDFDGKKNHVARVAVKNNNSLQFYMYIENDKGEEITTVDLGTSKNGYNAGFNQLAQLAITAGDYDGDGADEVVVYNASGEVVVYKVDEEGTPSEIKKIPYSDLATTSDNGGSDYNKYPQMQFTSGDITNDNRDELIITAGCRNGLGTTAITPRTTIFSQPKGENSLSQKAQFDHVWAYKMYNPSDTSGKAQRGAYGATAVGDVDGDGQNELVMASYDLQSDTANNDTALYQENALLSIVEYEEGTYKLGAGGVAQSAKTHPNLASGMWDTDMQQPIALACFNPYGSGEKDLIFVAGMVYELKMDSADASYQGVSLSQGHEASRYGYALIHQSDEIWSRNEKCYYGGSNSKTDNIWIGTVAVGNFMNDGNGGEQLIFEHGRKRDDKPEYRHDIVAIHLNGESKLTSDYLCINNDTSTQYKTNIDFTAIDNDDDGMLMRFKSKAAYFSNPSVVAVLQAAPYFADLEQIEPDYIEDGETVFGQTTGSGTGVTNGFSITAGAITGYKQETHLFGLVRLGGGEWSVELSASAGGDFESASEVSYSTEYSSDSRDDRVVLSMTPYVRYVYDMYVPEYILPTKEEYNNTLESLADEKDKEQYRMEVMKAMDSGYSWGDTVPASTSEYIVCMPNTPRMSMVEVSTYDKMAESNGFEKINGKVFNHTVGNPATYRTSNDGLEDFDGGRDVVGANEGMLENDFIWVSKGGGSVTQSIETTESDSKSVTWGAGISSTIQSDIAGVILGGTAGADYTGSYSWSNYSSTLCSGTVAGIPRDAVDLGYDFKWRFGRWRDTLNNEDCIVLGYLVDEVEAPPYAPLNLTVKDTTDTTVTLNWKHPSSMGSNYEIYIVTDNPSSPYYKLDTISSNVTEYVVTGLNPNTNYDFLMRSISSTAASAYTVPVTARTKYSQDANVPVIEMLPDIYAVAGSNPSFEVTATPAEGGTALTYQWQQLETDGSVSSWVDIQAQTGTKLQLNGVDKSMDGNMYRCMVSQFVDGNVAYVYTNSATLHVGAGATSTTITVDKDYGTAPGSYQIENSKLVDVSKEFAVTIGENKYKLSKDEKDGYMMMLDGGGDAQYMYIPTESGKSKIDNAIADSQPSVELGTEDVKALNGIFEFVDETGLSTNISTEVEFTDGTGQIIVGGEELTYSKTYTDESKIIYAVVTTSSEEGSDGASSEKTETKYYYDFDTADVSNEIVSVDSAQVGYSDGLNNYAFEAKQPIIVTVKEEEKYYTMQTVPGTSVNVTAKIESLSSGVVVTPNGTVEFTFTNNDTGTQTKQRVSLPKKTESNTNTVSYSWTPSVAGIYTVTARYIESVELMSSVSGEETYTAYAITSDKQIQIQKSLAFNCSDSILSGETIDMKPTLQETTVTDDGSEVTDTSTESTELSSDSVDYSVTFEYGASADGQYSFDGNVFKPTQTGTYIVTAEYKYTDEDNIGKTLTVSKKINVKAPDTKVQQQIFFAYSTLTKYSTDKNIINPLTNPNAGAAVEFTSSNTGVATVDKDGVVTPVGAGSTTITAVSKLSGAEDVQATYLLTIRKAPVTVTAPDITVQYGATQEEALEIAAKSDPVVSGGLSIYDITEETVSYSTNYNAGDNIGRYTLNIEEIESAKYEVETVSGNIIVEQKELSADDFDVTAQNKVYNALTDVEISAAVKEESKIAGDNVTVEIAGAFEDANAGAGKKVNYKIVSLGGTNSANYTLENGNVTGSVKADITKAPVTVTVIPKTTYIYDGAPKNVIVNAYANNAIFTDFTVEYDKGLLSQAVSEAVEAGEYDVDIKINDNAKDNYELVGYTEKAKLIIEKGEQEPFTIEGVSDGVSYGDTVTLRVSNSDGTVSYNVVSGDAELLGDQLTFTGVGSVTISATSKDDNYNDKTVIKQINVQRRELTPSASVVSRKYDGTVNVETSVSLDNVVSGDDITASAKGTMLTADAGNSKIVYISGMTLAGAKKDYYILNTQNIQSTVDIFPLEISGFTIAAFDKTYDGNTNAQAEVTGISGVLASDKEKVNISGNAVFENADAGKDKTVTYTAEGLTGIASGNYTLTSNTASATANIDPMGITVVTGSLSFVYDGNQKSVDISAFDSAGRAFDKYKVEYYDSEGRPVNGYPIEAGGYKVKFVLNDSTNYAASNTDFVMSILQASQEQISIVGLPGVIEYSDSFELEVIGGNGNGEVTWSSDSSDVTVKADESNSAKATVNINGSVGDKVTVSAVKQDDGNYTAKETKIVFIPSPKTVTFTIGDLSQIFDGKEKEVTVTPSVENAEYTITYNGRSDIPTDIGTYTVQVAATGNYTGNATATLVISKADMGELNVSIEDWTYGDTPNRPVYDKAPDGAEVDITYSTIDGKQPVNAGTYTVYATYSGANYETYVASYDFEIKKRVLNDDFEVTAQNKVYDGSTNAIITAGVKDSSKVNGDNLTVAITGSFENADAGTGKNVNYEITSLGGSDASNYELNNGKVTGTVKADIEKAQVKISVAPTTTYIYDGTPKTAAVSAYANDIVFTDFTVEYDKDSMSSPVSEAVDVGEYDVIIRLNGNSGNNYEIVGYDANAKLIIEKGAQESFTIEGIPERVSYGDTIKLSAPDAKGMVNYRVDNGAATISGDQLTFTGVGIVTITAVSESENYNEKTVTKQINVQRRELMPIPSVTDRAYDGTVNVETAVSFDNIVPGDEITASATGKMLNSDAGTDKIVYVSGIKLEGEKKDYYALSTQNIQAVVNISPLEITGFTVKAFDKTYDGSNEAQAEVTALSGVLESDIGKVGILGNAVFDNADAGEGRNVIFTAESLTGIAASNYSLTSYEASATANINPMDITFTTGSLSFVYDETEKNAVVSAFDSTGKVFENYTVEYYDSEDSLVEGLPVEAGDYKVKLVLGDSNNYTSSTTEFIMSILQASQEQIAIVGLPGIIEYSDSFELEVIGGNGNGEVEWSSDSSDVTVTVDNDNSAKATVTVNGSVGNKVTISAVKKDDGNYMQKETKIAFVPSPKTVTFTIGDLLQIYDNNPKSAAITPSVESAEYTVTYNGKTDMPVDAGTYTVKVIGTGNYIGNAEAALIISKAEMNQLDVSIDDWTYGDVPNEPVYIDAPEGTVVEITYSTADGKQPVNAGLYTVYATYKGANYETYVASDDFEIKKRTLTVTANDAVRSYGEANPVFTLSYEGFAQGESEENLLSVPIASTTATPDSPVKEGGYPIELYGGRADNYTFEYKNGVLDIVGASGGNFYIAGANNNATVGDAFTLRAYYNNLLPQVEWKSSDESIASITADGKVLTHKNGEVVITATITDSNYAPGISADFELEVNAVSVTLTPQNLVITYNGNVQGITFSSDRTDFIPVLSGENKNVEVTYTLKTNPDITEPKNVGEYTVIYQITDPSYSGSGTAQLTINKASIELRANDVSKTYGEENPEYTFTGLMGNDVYDTEYISRIRDMFTFTTDADSAGTKANSGEYPISVSLKEGRTLNDDPNYNITIAQNQGKLTVNPKALTVRVEDAARVYGEKNADPSYTYEGFVNEETEESLTKKPVFTYDENITEITDVGTYPNVITASGAESGNYTIGYVYANGADAASLTITQLPVSVSAGTSRSSYLTVNFDKSVPGLLKENFAVTSGSENVEITSAEPDSDSTSYTLKGSFKTGETYSVSITVSNNYTLNGSPISITPKAASGGSSGGGGGGGGSAVITYTVTFDSTGGSTIGNEKVERNETVPKPTDPTKEGYIFEGWYTDKECTKAFDFDTKISGNITLYAKWAVDNEVDSTDTVVKPTNPPVSEEWKNPFADVSENDWFYGAVKYATEEGLFSGITETEFAPNQAITRGMLVTVLWRAENEPVVNYIMTFKDVNESAYYGEAVRWAASEQIVNGYSETEFAPDKLISREEIAAIINRYANYKNIDTSAIGDLTQFEDYKDIADWASKNVSWAVGAGIMSGKGNGMLDPQGNTTRAETASILQRFMEN